MLTMNRKQFDNAIAQGNGTARGTSPDGVRVLVEKFTPSVRAHGMVWRYRVTIRRWNCPVRTVWASTAKSAYELVTDSVSDAGALAWYAGERSPDKRPAFDGSTTL